MIGQTLSHFKITAKLGEGGMGVVYRAEDAKLGREVALKILPPELVDRPDRLQRFELEAKSASALSHPHIVTIYEIGKAELDAGVEVHYIAMELVDGDTFKDKIHREQAPLRDLLRWLAQATDGLAKAHAAGILHRDLKPDNIMVTRDGYAKVLDFGLAKLTEPIGQEGTRAPTIAAEQTAEGAVLGTVGYMSPEQVQGKSVDHRTDVFSFGCVLYEAMTRQRPFAGETAVDTMHQILRAKPHPVRELSPNTPGAVRRLIRRCLHKDPERRFQSMKDLAFELKDLVDEWDDLSVDADSSTSRGTEGLSPITEPTARRNWLAIATAAAVVALVGWLFYSRPWQAESARDGGPVQASFNPLTKQVGIEGDPALSPDGKYLAYNTVVEGRVDIYLLRVGGQNPLNLTASQEGNHQTPAFSPDGEEIVFRSSRDGGGLFIMGATGESVRRLTDVGYDPDWSSDGQRVAFVTEPTGVPNARGGLSSLWIGQVDSGETLKIYDGDAMQPEWSPDGSRLALWGVRDIAEGGGQRDIGTIGAEGGEVVWLTDDEALDWNPVWSPDGSFLYFLSDRGGSWNIWRVGVDSETGAANGEPHPLTAPSKQVSRIAISGDGSRIVYSDTSSSRNLARLELDPVEIAIDGPLEPITRGSNVYVAPMVSPDGEWVTFSGLGQGRGEDIFVVRADGGELRQLTDDAERDRVPSWTPDGERIVFYSHRQGRYEIWTIGLDGSGLQRLTQSTGDSWWFPAWSPDGRWVATFNRLGTGLWDVTNQLPTTEMTMLPPVDAAGRVMINPRWSRDGQQLAGQLAEEGLNAVGLVTYSMESGEYETVYLCEPGSSVGVADWLNEDKSLITMIQKPDGKNDLVVLDLASGDTRKLAEFPSDIAFNSISSDDRMLFLSETDQQSDLWLATLE